MTSIFVVPTGDRVAYSVGANFTPHVITVNAGEVLTFYGCEQIYFFFWYYSCSICFLINTMEVYFSGLSCCMCNSLLVLPCRNANEERKQLGVFEYTIFSKYYFSYITNTFSNHLIIFFKLVQFTVSEFYCTFWFGWATKMLVVEENKAVGNDKGSRMSN